MKAYIIGIVHNHAGEFSATVGQLQAESQEDAVERATFWVKRKLNEYNCERYGNNCTLSVRSATGLHGSGLLAGAEEIDLTEQA